MGKKEIIKKILKLNKFKDLNPVQKEAFEKGVLKEKNLIAGLKPDVSPKQKNG